MNKKNKTLLLLCMGIITITLSVVGATYAWFMTSITNPNGSSITVTLANLGVVTFNDGNMISMNDVLSGSSATKRFTISRSEAIGDINVSYKVQLIKTQNTLSAAANGAFDYELTGETNKTGTVINSSGDVPLGTGASDLGIGTLENNEVHTYDFTLYVRELNLNQNSIEGKSFEGYLQVSSENYSTGS